MKERRLCARWPICQPVNYRIQNCAKECFCKSLNLGLKGIELKLQQDFLTDAPIDLEIFLKDQDKINAQAKKVWQKELKGSPDEHIAGFQFIGIRDTDKEKLFDYMITDHRDMVVQHWWEGVDDSLNR